MDKKGKIYQEKHLSFRESLKDLSEQFPQVLGSHAASHQSGIFNLYR